MPSDTYLFMVWAHRSADSIFGAAAHPVIRNGAFLCFDSEAKAHAESDRLNARSGGSHVLYGVQPTRVRMSLPQTMHKEKAAQPAFALPLLAAPCTVSPR